MKSCVLVDVFIPNWCCLEAAGDGKSRYLAATVAAVGVFAIRPVPVLGFVIVAVDDGRLRNECKDMDEGMSGS